MHEEIDGIGIAKSAYLPTATFWLELIDYD
jgi:hypothetical protein